MNNNHPQKEELTIFSIGVHLKAIECIINGIKQWRWIAIKFEDNSFSNGEYANPLEYGNSIDSLLQKD